MHGALLVTLFVLTFVAGFVAGVQVYWWAMRKMFKLAEQALVAGCGICKKRPAEYEAAAQYIPTQTYGPLCPPCAKDLIQRAG